MIETYAKAANGGRIGFSEGTNLRNKMSVLMNKMANLLELLHQKK